MRRSERLHAGSIPASATFGTRRTEAIRLDEGPVLKTGGGEEPLVSSSLTASALRTEITEVIRIGEEPAWKAGGGSDAACGFESHGFRSERYWGHGPTGRHWFRNPEIRVRLSVTPLDMHGPVAQRQRRHPYKVIIGGSSPPRTTFAQVRQLGRAARLKPERLRVRLPLWAHAAR